MNSSLKSNWIPFWSTPFKIENGGRYPLGLNHFHNHLDSYINRNIVYGSDKLRYITFYCWAIGDIHKTVKLNNYAEFVEQFTLRENAFSCGLYINPHKYAVRGSNALKKFQSLDDKEYDMSFRLMESKSLGAFEQYYAGTMYGFGLIYYESGIPLLTSSGNDIYNIADKYYSETKYYKNNKGKRFIPKKILVEWGKLNDLNNIRENESLSEIEIYKKLIFYLDNKAHDYRRDTFVLYLQTIDWSLKNKVDFKSSFWSMMYFGKTFNKKDEVCEVDIPVYLQDVYTYWKIYFIHSMFSLWLERYFGIFLSYLKENSEGVSINEFIDDIDSIDFDKTISYFLKRKNKYFNSRVSNIFDLFGNEVDITSKHSEYNVHFDETCQTRTSQIAKITLILLNIILRAKNLNKDKKFFELLSKFSGDLWFGRLLLDFNNIEKFTVKEFMVKILDGYIIHQHNEIMIQKDDLRRCWFTIENNRYIFQADNSPIWSDGHFNTVMSYLYDMNLIDYIEDNVSISTEGKLFVKKILKEYYKQ